MLFTEEQWNFVAAFLLAASIVGPILAIKWFLFGGKKK